MKRASKNRIMIFSIIILFPFHLFSQCPTVTWLNPIPHGNSIQNIAFTPAGNSIIITEKGEIFKSKDEGKSWQLVHKSNNRLYALSFYRYIGFAVGWNGEMLKSEDGGETWTQIYLQSTTPLRNVIMLNESTAFIIDWDGKVLKTEDQGKTWKDFNIANNARVGTIKFLNSSLGFAAGNGKIYRTEDGGKNWTTFVFGDTEYVSDFHFIDEITGIAVGGLGIDGPVNQSKMYRTNNGGITWAPVVTGTNGALNTVTFSNASTGYAAGWENTIVKTEDGGVSWKEINTVEGGLNFWFNDIVFTDLNTGYAVGVGGQIVKTEDTGITWRSLTNFSIAYFQSAQSLNDTTWFAAGENGGIYKTIDKGKKWHKQNTRTNDWLNGIKFLNKDTGFAVGGNNTAKRATLLKTTDGGTNWKSLMPPAQSLLCDIEFVDDLTGFVVGAGGVILKTENSGESWKGLTSGTTSSLTDIAFIDKDSGFAVGSGGIVLRTVDGNTWKSVARFTDNFLYSVFFLDNKTGYIGGGYGDFYKTTNGGNTWEKKTIPYYLDIHSITFVNKDTGYFAGDEGRIYKTLDGGKSWTKVHDGGYRILDIQIINKNKILAVGHGGQIVTLSSDKPERPKISGIAKTCPGKRVYKVRNSETGVVYTWTFNNTKLSTTKDSCEIVLNASGTFILSVTANNGCGEVTSDSFQIEVTPEVSTPVLSQNDSVLTSSEGKGYLWYLDDKIIEGAGGRQLKIENAGNYKVSVEGNCGRVYSDPFEAKLKCSVSVSLADFDVVCQNLGEVKLVGGSPEGGVYSGPGVADGYFNPSKTGTGEHLITYTYVTASGCTGSISRTIKAEICGGREVINNDVSIYPNPVQKSLKILPNNSVIIKEIEVVDQFGRTILVKNSVQHDKGGIVEVDTDQLSRGIYLLRIKTRNRNIVAKIIVD